MIHYNPAVLSILGIKEQDFSSAHNLLENTLIAQNKKKLFKDGLIKFQSYLNLENIQNIVKDQVNINPLSYESSFIEWTVFLIDSGFLLQIQDVTDLKKAEKLLKESEEKYRGWFDDDLTGDFIASPEGDVLECNPSFVEMYGFKNLEKAVNSNISDFNPSDWRDMVQHLQKEHKLYDYQTWHRRPDGKEMHVVANVVGIFDGSGELREVKGYVFDDTERKIAEESLRGSEEKYHRLFDEDLTGDFIATLDGKILECNPAFADIYGFFDVESALQWNISQSNPFDWPYIVTRLKSERKIQGFQSWQRRSDGMRIHVVANVVGIFDGSGELREVKGYVFDDTERKIAEEELSRSKHQITEILDSIKDSFIALGYNWEFIYVNKYAAEFFGVEPDDLIGQNLWQRFPEILKSPYEAGFRKAMEHKEIQHFEVQGIISPEYWYDVSVYPSAEGISAYWRDITERKQLEEQLRNALK